MQDPSILCEHSDSATCVAVSTNKEWIAVGFSDNQVHLLKYPSGAFEKILIRLQCPVRHVAFSPDGLYLAVAGEGSIKLVNLVESTQVTLFKGHQGVVRSLAFDPRGDYFASAGADGTVRVWSLAECTEVASLPLLVKGDPDRHEPPLICSAPLLSRLDWHPHGTLLAVPTTDGVALVKRDGWDVVGRLQGEHRQGGVNLFRWSPNGLYAASAGHRDQTVFVWRVATREAIDKVTCRSAVLGLSWSPAANALALINASGKWALWQDVIPPAWPSPFGSPEESEKATASDGSGAEHEDPSAPRPTASSLIADLFDHDEGVAAAEDEAKTESTKKKKVRKMKTKKASTKDEDDDLAGMFDDEAVEADGDEEGDQQGEEEEDIPGHRGEDLIGEEEEEGATSAAVPEDGMDLAGLDDDAGGDESAAAAHESTRAGPSSSSSSSSSVRPYRVVRIPPMKAQPAFQPNAGPAIESTRYLAWTLFGLIEYTREDSSSFIEVEFTDATTFKNFRMANLYNFTMAAMGPRGALFAARSGEGFPANLMFRPFNSWAANAEWTIKMPSDEEIDAIAVGDGWCAAATSTSTLRIISTGGIQLAVVALPGPAVAVAAHEHLLAVAYHLTPPTRDRQNIELKLIDVRRSECIATAAVPLNASRATLQWLGFSDLGTALVRDSVGQVYGLFNSFGWSWVPIFNFADVAAEQQAEASLDDPRAQPPQFWVVGLRGEQLLCVACDPDTEQPPAGADAARPDIVGFPLSLPLVKDTPVGVDEERLLKNKLLIEYKRFMVDTAAEEDEGAKAEAELRHEQVEADKHLLSMIQKACQSSKAARALDYAAQLIFPKSLAIAVQLAERHSLTELASRMEALLTKKAEKLNPSAAKAPQSREEVDDGDDDEGAVKMKTKAQSVAKRQAVVVEEQDDTQLPEDGEVSRRKDTKTGKKRTREEEEDEDKEQEDEDAGDEDEDEDELSDYERNNSKRRRLGAEEEEASKKPSSKPAPVLKEPEQNLIDDMFGADA